MLSDEISPCVRHSVGSISGHIPIPEMRKQTLRDWLENIQQQREEADPYPVLQAAVLTLLQPPLLLFFTPLCSSGQRRGFPAMEQTQALCQWGPPAFCGPRKAPTKVRQDSSSPATGWSRVGRWEGVNERWGFQTGTKLVSKGLAPSLRACTPCRQAWWVQALLCLGPSKTTFLHPRRDSAQSKRKHRIIHRTSGVLMVDKKPVHQRWLPYTPYAHTT